jgi:hypothetical protein
MFNTDRRPRLELLESFKTSTCAAHAVTDELNYTHESSRPLNLMRPTSVLSAASHEALTVFATTTTRDLCCSAEHTDGRRLVGLLRPI